MPKLGTICITNQADTSAVIDIEGIIGVPEWWQFDDPSDRVATFDKFKKKCNEIKSLKAKNIIVNIRSLGGSTLHAFLIHDSLCQLEAEITTICYGYTASAATLIAQAGKVRQISSNALYLIHQCSSVVRGNIADMHDEIQAMEKTNERILNLYVERSGRKAEEIKEILDRKNGNGEWISPEEAVKAGLADEIVKVSGSVNIDVDLFNELAYPQIPDDMFPIEEDEKDPTLTQNNSLMIKIKNSLASLWAFLKLPSDVAEHEITDEQLTEINAELASREKTINDLTTERDTLKESVDTKDARISALESEVATLKAKPGDTTKGTTNKVDGEGNEGNDVFNTMKEAKELYNSVKDI